MVNSVSATRVLAVALGVGLAAELLLDGHALGINVPLATAVLLVATAAIAGGIRRIDPLDAWIPCAALVLAAFTAIRDDGPLLLLDVTGALGLTAASAPAFAGEAVTRRTTAAILALAARVVTAVAVGGAALSGRVHAEADPLDLVARRASRATPVVRGLLLGIPPVLIFAALFASADPIFGRWMDTLVTVDVELGELPGRLLFTALATWLAGGLLWFAWVAGPPLEPRSLGAAVAAPAGALGSLRLGAVEALTLLVALDLLFGAFVALQLAYLFGNSDTLGAIGMTHADYARRGFFELVAVVVLVGGLLLGLEAAIAHRTRAYVAAALVLVGLTAVVLASSLKRLWLYQDAYGWTELRFYVLAAIAFLAIDLAAAAWLIFRNRSQWLPHAVAASSLVVLVGVNLVGPQATITARNLERALMPAVVPEYGERTLDTTYLGSLDADAVPQLVAALPGLSEPQRRELRPLLADAHRRYVLERDASWQGANLARERARAALEGLFRP
jgi:hypothetical protein